MEFCPVCMLRRGLAGGVISGESSVSEEMVEPAIPNEPARRFEHYELVTGEDGKPVELGRGAMGVTYKAFDINLRCPVTLKVISERYLGDESTRLRFLREARAAASVRHPNVASVFHLGTIGQNCFYAMEFVEGETLEKLIKRSGRLEIKLALEITTQVAAGLAAVQEQNLVHRDIKPSNIMVRLKDGGAATVKIIDLGLAKPVNEPRFTNRDFCARRLCRYTGVCQSRAIRRSRPGHPLGSVLAGCDALGDVDRHNAIPGHSW
jgi:serine/threonine protein kinase